ncbi:DUF1800 family protein [Asticcacaulis sp. AND118]|uniref:DUF1800 domain-containing protein n=1 Tax=Asticcacaulis sp. AND118 TaxID=2840468 RepID=UPI001CFFF41F|nr:DUF1800 domain-containing protein [Asticcacaulis sp. AND118]UDF05251.1 DUF1800 domain-containing protein [Asticcacaulis sp. AND118]
MLKRSRSVLGRLIHACVITSLCLMSACGGGGGGGGNSGGSSGGSAPPAVVRPTAAEASRFLAQASFGATDADVAAVSAAGYSDWINAQIALPISASHLDQMDARLVELRETNANASLSSTQFYESFYRQAVTGPDPLRQRVKFALSEIFVTSYNSNINVRTVASYYDMLGRNAFGNFRTLLQDVTYHPAMGQYLTYLANQKENTATGRNPDENYAREVMQLFTIGLYQLNTDGTPKTDLFGNTTPTYATADIQGLARVFTGLSWYHPTPTNSTFFGGSRDALSYTRPMIGYANYHSTSAKSFLGTTIPASTTVNIDGDVNTALDTLFNHPNVGPFISKQLIQRLVTSNPSPAYVGRVAAIFNNNGSGVRGDMAAVVRAILLDSEARTASTDMDYGKLREPVIRLTHWMRAFETTSASGKWLMTSTAAQTSLNQAPLTSASVFNFFRPGYVAPNTTLGGKGKVAPEMQITDEVTTASYVNLMQGAINSGIGASSDIKSTYAKELPLATDPAGLVERMDLLLYGGRMSSPLKSKIVTAVTGITIPANGTQAQIDTAKLNRVKLAILLSMASPEYIAQR